MMSKTFAVIGDPINHSLSPNIHSAAFRELNLDCSYIAYRIPRGELAQGIEALKKIKISGFNVTIPHKIEMMRYLDITDESSSLIGATNTVVNQDGVLKGYNTDMDGFLRPLKERKIDLSNKRVLLLGAGGAARAIVAGLAIENTNNITIANRTLQNADTLVKFAVNLDLDASAVHISEIADTSKYDIIINATSIGLQNEPSPIKFDNISEETIVYDIVYMPINTDFIQRAKASGATIIFGYEMLLGQAVRAFEIWHKIKAPYKSMQRALLGGV